NEIIEEINNYSLDSDSESTGLTFEQFCILAADFKRLRGSTNIIRANPKKHSLSKSSSFINDEIRVKNATNKNIFKRSSSSPADRLGPEVFLGGSCNPTTWRADVAIPILQKLGISFYNPQVSEWTPDLIELEQKAKEKAKVLFFVMDSQTRATAGAIEAAHIAAQNPRQLVLVLHPYKMNQQIFKETISIQEYYDLQRNQQILKEMVTRRGLFVLEDISSGLERTKEIVTGARESSSNVRTVLNVVWRAFTRVLNLKERSITIQQCEKALRSLGYTQNLLTTLNLTQVIFLSQQYKQKSQLKKMFTNKFQIFFEDFCIITAYFSILQQEVYDSGCTSPIKGMIAPHPPIYLANVQVVPFILPFATFLQLVIHSFFACMLTRSNR
uniref:Uncharacterized protein n=1 Tax=Megaselia scalaris TaxID=36166 RepID=T1GVN7_MEGSC